MGEVTRGKFGGGFLYTNRESVSLGIVVGIEEAAEDSLPIEVPALMDAFKERPEICHANQGRKHGRVFGACNSGRRIQGNRQSVGKRYTGRR